MPDTLLAEVLGLPMAERAALLDAIWSSLARETEAMPVSHELALELDRRLAQSDADPSSGIEWGEARSRIERGVWRDP
jgi:putative addiction module component (TIGR02574 family)